MKIFIKLSSFVYNTHVNGLYTNYSCVTLKKYEFNLTLKKAYFTGKKMDEIKARNKIEAI